MMHLLDRAALYLDYGDEETAKKLTNALDEVVASLEGQKLNPLQIALDRLDQ